MSKDHQLNKAVNNHMTEWLTLNRLVNNNLPLPRYETPQSAGMDFPACLLRPQRMVPEGGNFKSSWPFYQSNDGSRSLILESDMESDAWVNHKFSGKLSIKPGETVMVSLGYQCQFGKSYVLLLHIRSSIGMMGLQLANNTGIIDPDYRGELWAVIYNRNKVKTISIDHGDRLVQGVMLGFNQAVIEEGDICETERGIQGFGSTGLSIKHRIM